MKVAIVHEWLEHYAGSERVLEELLALFPQADLYALVDFVPAAERGFLRGHSVRTSFIQRLPFARRGFRNYLGLMPLAVEQFDLAGYDLVLSSNHAVAKGVITGPDQVHVSYVHSPMRYAWDLQAQYLRQSGLDRGAKGLYARWLLHRLRNWDVRSSNGVDVFVANSSYIADRIRKVYRREAVVVAPPVDVGRFMPGAALPGASPGALPGAASGGAYLVASRFVPYKRVELIVEAFAAMPERRLLVVGDGPERERVRRAAAGHANIEVRPPVTQSDLVGLMQGARAFVFAAEEDFGITLVEAQACGVPLIAFGRGGARDIVVDADRADPTGVLFGEQTVESLVEAVLRFEAEAPRITPTACRANAVRFSAAVFRTRMMEVVTQALEARAGSPRAAPPVRAPSRAA